MPLNSVNLLGSTRDAHCNNCKTKTPVSGEVPSAGLAHGAVVPKGGPAAAGRTSERPPAGMCDMKLSCLPDGYKNHQYQASGKKVPPAKVDAQPPSLGSTLTEGPAAGPVSNGGFPCWISDTEKDNNALPCNHDLKPTGQFLPAARKKQRRKKKFNHKKRNEVVDQKTTLPPALEKEDWESEIQEVSVLNLGELCFGTSYYGPEDLLDFSVRSSTLNDWGTPIIPMTDRYKPFACHPRPIQWFHSGKLPEKDQFEDAEKREEDSSFPQWWPSHEGTRQNRLPPMTHSPTLRAPRHPLSSHDSPPHHTTPRAWIPVLRRLLVLLSACVPAVRCLTTPVTPSSGLPFSIAHLQRGALAADAAGARPQAAHSMVSPTMKALVDAVWAVWSIGASIYDYIHTSAMEERIHVLENIITIHQCVIGLLSACVLVLLTYILFKKL